MQVRNVSVGGIVESSGLSNRAWSGGVRRPSRRRSDARESSNAAGETRAEDQRRRRRWRVPSVLERKLVHVRNRISRSGACGGGPRAFAGRRRRDVRPRSSERMASRHDRPWWRLHASLHSGGHVHPGGKRSSGRLRPVRDESAAPDPFAIRLAGPCACRPIRSGRVRTVRRRTGEGGAVDRATTAAQGREGTPQP